MLSSVILLAACIASEIGMYHRAEENYWQNDDYIILLELSAPGGNAEKAFHEAYLIVDSHERIEMKVLNASRESVRFEGRIPSTAIRNAVLSYRFEFTASGRTRRSPVYEASPRPEPEQ